MSTNTEILGNALKVSTPLPIHNSVVMHSEVFDLWKSRSPLVARRQGRITEMPLQFGTGEGIGSRFEDGNAPEADVPLIERALFVWKKTLMTIEATNDAIDEAVEGPTAYASFQKLTIMPKVEGFMDDLDRQSIGFGAGPVCRISDNWTPGANPVLIDRAFGLGSDDVNGWIVGIRRGMRFVAGPSLDGGGLRNGGAAARVLSLDPDANSGAGAIYIDGAIPTEWGVDDYLWKGDLHGHNAPENGVEKEMMGLRGFLDNGDLVPVCQNIDRSQVYEFRGRNVDVGTAYTGVATSLMFMRLHDESRIYGKGRIDTILCTPAIFRNAVNANSGIVGNPSPQVAGGVVQTGAKGIVTQSFGAGPVNVRSVVKMIPGNIMALDSSTLVRFGMEMMEWDDHGGFWKPITVGGIRKDAFYNIGRFRGQLGCTDPRKNVLGTGVLETS